MENSVFTIEEKGQALIEFCLILTILISLCVFGFYRIGLMGNKKMEVEKQRFEPEKLKISYEDVATPIFSEPLEGESFSLISDAEDPPLKLLPFGDEKMVFFKSQGRIVQIAQAQGNGEEIASHYRKQFQEQNWVEQEEYGIWIFSKQNQRAFLWTTDQEVAVVFY